MGWKNGTRPCRCSRVERSSPSSLRSATVVGLSWAGSYTSTRPRPRAFARSMASLASLSTSSGWWCHGLLAVTPMLTPTACWCPRTLNGAASTEATAAAISRKPAGPDESRDTRTNSSPKNRPRVHLLGKLLVRRLATAWRSSSPAPRPRLSFTVLKRLRSQ